MSVNSNTLEEYVDCLFNNLVKSRFIELFGTRLEYASKWEMRSFTDCCDVLYGFPFNSDLFNEEGQGKPLIRIRDINSGLSGTYTTEVADSCYIVNNGDILVSMDGDFCSKEWDCGEAYLNQRTCKMKGKENIIDDTFMLHYLTPELDEIHRSTSATTVKHLSAKEINRLKIPVPPIDMQISFAKFAKLVDKSKFIGNVTNHTNYNFCTGLFNNFPNHAVVYNPGTQSKFAMSEYDLTDEDISEYKTRKILIDESLRDAGWIENKDWINEYELQGMPNPSKVGYADYVLFGDDGRPLAVVEAKRTTKDPAIGRHQAELYAGLLKKKFGRMPVIFLTNGYETRIIDSENYQERKVWGIYCKRDLEKLFNLAANRSVKLSDATINDNITNRYYQKGAIKAACSAFEQKYRKALLVMATGSGKTRTVISLVDVMLRKGWVKNILFLADRTSLVKQAKKEFVNLLPNLSVANMCVTNEDVHARCIFSTYQTMINLIDTTREKDKTRTFSNGHFDLIIVDEAHRSIYKKYKEIFDYFDGLLVGLTATPKDEIDRNTYEIFNLPHGEPTYGYELAQAVKDGYLVDFKTVEVQTKFLQRGIEYVDLTDEEKEEYEDLFIDDDGTIPEKIENSKLNEWIFNRDTIIRVLDTVMRMGLKVNDGSTIGKTIIFAKKHIHAEKILEIFNEQYPSYLGMCQVIDNKTSYADNLIDEFKKPESKVRIAISVDMLDTGIDIPELLNLVFFKPVYSKAKFWQMIGRGTRLCPGIIDGKDKEMFYIFDFCGSFEFFRIHSTGIQGNDCDSIQGRIFTVKCMMAHLLQDIKFQEEPYISFRKEIVEDIQYKINELNRDNFTVIQHLRAVNHYNRIDVLNTLSQDDVINMNNELAHLILPYPDDPQAIRMDALMFVIEEKFITGNPLKILFKEVRKRAELLSTKALIPDVAKRMDIIRLVLTSDYLEKCDLSGYERIRKELREIVQYIECEMRVPRETNFIDEVISIDINDSDLEDESLANYREKAEHYVRSHQDEDVIKKLKTNEPLDDEDISKLESILWSEIGSKEDYEAEFGSKPLGVFVREIIGLDMKSAKEAFSKYLDDSSLDSRQIYFVNQIVEYVAQNGVLSNYQVLTESPFTDRGSIVDIFSDLTVWNGIKSVIEKINNNAGC